MLRWSPSSGMWISLGNPITADCFGTTCVSLDTESTSPKGIVDVYHDAVCFLSLIETEDLERGAYLGELM